MTDTRTWANRGEAPEDNAESREARIRHYMAMYEQGRSLFTGELLPEKERRLHEDAAAKREAARAKTKAGLDARRRLVAGRKGNQ